ncbi:uncharacterized protein DDB_G0283357 isoform X2 [Acyrthosiphon pisum]|uniref:Caprin-1 dimerization domain-containing protein n=1 Tax=Acyrthosiphon pisum TaxID=7029 RepID=A0A8R2FDA3_ACYPI|nr:uncharacterized protein DDB_G0283357 isoform X2 [Acyrthosiphon pisum]|eukprot:XP_008189911.1 PREDICTED: uncharacterized protein DDB_G0283357 isoform X2 [Acyrthosiphon pisum]
MPLVYNSLNILESIKDKTVKQDLLAGNNGAVQLTDDELSQLSYFSKMVSPKRRVEEGKPLFEDQLKTVSKHYMKLIDSKPNIVAGTSYAHLKECLLKIEKSGYLNNLAKLKHADKEVNTINEDNSLETKIPQHIHQSIASITEDSPDNIPISSIPNLDFTPNKIETIYFTNNNIGGNTVEQNLQKSKNTTDSVLNTSFDFLQDSQLEEDIISIDLNSIPTQTFSSSIYANHGPTDDAILKILSTPPQHRTLETKQNHLENVVDVNTSNSNSWTGKTEVNWQSKTESGDSNDLPRESWSMAQMINNSTNNDWLIKNNWVQMAEVDKQNQSPAEPTQPSPKHSSSNFGLVTNGYTENLDELLQKSVVFNKQESYPVTTSSNNSTYYQTNYGQQSLERNIGHYTNSNGNPRSHSNDFNKRSTSMKPKASYTGEGGPSRGYQQGNSYVYNNRSYKTNSNTNTSNDYSRISQTR